jgi:hypothetical protein
VIERPEAGHTPLALRFATLALYVAAMLLVIRPALRRWVPVDPAGSLGWFGAAMIFLLALFVLPKPSPFMPCSERFWPASSCHEAASSKPKNRDRLESVTVVLLLPLFLAYAGLRTSVALLNTAGAWLLCGLILLIAVGSKLLVSAVCVRASGMP